MTCPMYLASSVLGLIAALFNAATTYSFHLQASQGRKKNQIKVLYMPDGRLTEVVGEMEEIATSFYSNIYISEGDHDMDQVLYMRCLQKLYR